MGLETEMKIFTPIAFAAILVSCKHDEPQEAQSRVHAIELSDPLGVVQVTVAGKKDLMVNVFERDGRLVAAVIDRRNLSDGRLQEIQRWEMLAKSNREVALSIRKDFHWLEYVNAADAESPPSPKFSNGTVLYGDTNGDGIPDYLFSSSGRFMVSNIGYEAFETSVTSFDMHELPPVTPDEVFSVSPENPESQEEDLGRTATRGEPDPDGGENPQPESEERSR